MSEELGVGSARSLEARPAQQPERARAILAAVDPSGIRSEVASAGIRRTARHEPLGASMAGPVFVRQGRVGSPSGLGAVGAVFVKDRTARRWRRCLRGA